MIDVTVRDLRDAARLQSTLRADGVPASVTFGSEPNPSCREYPGRWDLSTSGIQVSSGPPAIFAIHPAALPRGAGVQIDGKFDYAYSTPGHPAKTSYPPAPGEVPGVRGGAGTGHRGRPGTGQPAVHRLSTTGLSAVTGAITPVTADKEGGPTLREGNSRRGRGGWPSHVTRRAGYRLRRPGSPDRHRRNRRRARPRRGPHRGARQRRQPGRLQVLQRRVRPGSVPAAAAARLRGRRGGHRGRPRTRPARLARSPWATR